MSGGRIKIAKQALILFIRSLPSNSKFNVCSFGSTFDYIFEESAVYSNESMNKAISNIETFTAGYGGTELLPPFEDICAKNTETEYPRSVFILTDGSISNTEDMLKKISENNHHTRVHSFGVGSGTSKYLVNEMAKLGLGSSTIVDDDDNRLNAKVIRALKYAAKPAFTNFSLNWSENQSAVKLITPEAPNIPNVYEEEPFQLYAILDESKMKNSQLSITMFNTNEQTDDTLVVSINPEDIIESDSTHSFQIAARKYIDFTTRFSKEEKKVKDELILDVSVKYSVLSDQTAFFGKIKNKDKSGEEMQLIEVPIKKLNSHEANEIGFRSQALFRKTDNVRM